MALYMPTKETIWLDKWMERNSKAHWQARARYWLSHFNVTDEHPMDEAAIDCFTKELDHHFGDWCITHSGFEEDILDAFIGAVDWKEIASWWLDQELEALQSEK